MGGGGVGKTAELVEVSSAAEGGPHAVEHDLLEARIGERDVKTFDQGVAHLARECVAFLGPIERKAQPVTAVITCLSQDPHRRPRHRGPRRALATRGQPASKLRPGLQGRVDERLGHQPIVDRAAFVVSKQLHQRERSERMPLAGTDQRWEIRFARDHHVEALEQRRRGALLLRARDRDGGTSECLERTNRRTH